MAKKRNSIDHKPPESLVATLTLRGREFPFRIFSRPIRLDSYGTVQYYWMDSSQFRSLRTAADLANFRSAIGFWTAGMQQIGAHRDIDQQIHFILAVTYSLVCRRKSLQNIVLDAYLTPDASRRSTSTSLPKEIQKRIQMAVASRDRMKVQAELVQLLKRFTVPPQLMPLLQEAFRRWVGKGVVMMRQHGNEGIKKFLDEADYWMQKFRKRSDRWVRHFLDLFAYECKAAFHTCYANAWVSLIPWLREHRGLDELSERFMRFWHNQNQPIEIPHGQTASGIIYPTHRGIILPENGSGRHQRGLQSLSVATEQIGPTHVGDVFQGQVLSLHPMSGFFMKDAALCAIAGRFFASDAYKDAQQPRLIRRCPEYWDFVGAILTATHIYRQAVDRQSQRRGVAIQSGAESLATHAGDDLVVSRVFEDYATEQRLKCSHCGGKFRFVKYTPASSDDAPVEVKFACQGCKRQHHQQISWGELAPWIKEQ